MGGEGACCNCTAFPSCASGETSHAPGTPCPSGNVCHEVTVCGTTILCASPAPCDGYPQCDPGDTLIQGACPPDVECYPRTLCGITVSCVGDTGAAGAGGVGSFECHSCEATACTSSSVWIQHTPTCCECRACPLGFVDCTRAASTCVKIGPDTDDDGCCACFTP